MNGSTIWLFIFGILIAIIQVLIAAHVRMILTEAREREQKQDEELRRSRDRLHRLEAAEIEHRRAINDLARQTGANIGIL